MNAQTLDQTIETGIKTFDVDASHSQVGFRVKHLGFSKVRGSFQEYDAVITLDPTDLTTLAAEATIRTASIDTGSADRDAHLRSDDFFASDLHPTMTFATTGVAVVEGEEFTIDGALTIRDVTKPVVLRGRYQGTASDPWGNERVAVEARTRVNRKEFGLVWNQVLETGGLLVSDEVEIVLEVEAIARATQG